MVDAETTGFVADLVGAVFRRLLRIPVALLAALITPLSTGISTRPSHVNPGKSAADSAPAPEPTTAKVSWYRWTLGVGESWLAFALKQGEIPKHIAFIMDGNRRYARRREMEVGRGHALGFDRLRETLDWCLKLGVDTVTVYAFSLENFKRSKAEVDGLMDLCRAKFEVLMGENDLIQKHGVRINIIGDISTLPPDLQRVVGRIVTMSRHNTRLVLNVALAYTSRHEITEAVRSVAQGVAHGGLSESDVTEDVIERCLLTEDARPPDLVVRTSGETRLSDFMLWQGGYSCIHFTEVLWPDFSYWDFAKCVVHFQSSQPALERLKATRRAGLERDLRQTDMVSAGYADPSEIVDEGKVAAAAQERESRVGSFLRDVHAQRDIYFEQLASQ